MGVTQEIHDKWNPKSFNGGVRLWWLSPSFRDLRYIDRELHVNMFYASKSNAYAVLWLKPTWFGNSRFTWPEFKRWIPHSSLVSGSGENICIGIILSNQLVKDKRLWGDNKNIWSVQGGSKSSETCKWLLDRLMPDGEGIVVDPYAQSADLASWCKRLNVEYRGYTENQELRDKIEKALAQLELPGIQEVLPL